jgi:predicted ATPase/DNA-binding SARP family transcriptional activator
MEIDLEKDQLRIQLLGGFSVSAGAAGIEEKQWRLRKAKSLVKLLCLAPDRKLHAETVGETLWPELAPDAARNNLHQATHAARRAFDLRGADGQRCLQLSDGLLLLCPEDPIWIDAVAFERAAGSARELQRAAAYVEALTLYTGELLPEDRFEDWTSVPREALRDLRLALGIELAELQAAAGKETEAVDTLRSALVAQPLHEPAHRALMRLYAKNGRRQEALAQFQQLKRDLKREFEDEPDDETRRLYQELLTRSLEGDGSRPSNLPTQLTSFVGRQRELEQIATAFGATRLLTLTGVGGAGKTRLALELASRLGGHFQDGVWLVELAAIADPALIWPAIGEALDVRLASERAPEVALAEHIGDRELLLVLDNCEHLIAEAARAGDALLRSCPGLRVLATSREPLRVAGEVVWRVPSLSLPEIGGTAEREEVEHSEAVRLFAERARQAAPSFVLNDDNLEAVATLCHRLDGMPLAIELAAARAGTLAPGQIVERLDGALDLLASGSRSALTRQQTLRATLAWSHELLDDDERVLQRRLSVFAGSFALEAAEEICATDPLERGEIAGLLGRLVDKSLVQVEDEGEARRYRLLETVRQYGVEQLEAAGELRAFEERHLDCFIELAISDPTPTGDLPSGDWLQRLDRERENLRAALGTALRVEPSKAMRLAIALWGFWFVRGYLAEGDRWLEAVLAAAPEPTAERAQALLAECMFSFRRSAYRQITARAAESAEISRELEDQSGVLAATEVSAAGLAIVGHRRELEALMEGRGGPSGSDPTPAQAAISAANTRGLAAWLRTDYQSARQGFEDAEGRLDEVESSAEALLLPLTYGMVLVQEGVPQPIVLQEETVVLGRRVGAAAAAAYLLVNLAAVDRVEARPDDAERRLRESVARFKELQDPQGEALALNASGSLASHVGDFDRAQDLFERSLAMREELGDRRGVGLTLGGLGVLLARSGEDTAARAMAERCHRWFSHDDDQIGLSSAELCLAYTALRAGDLTEAAAHFETTLHLLERMSAAPQQGWSAAALAGLAIEAGRLDDARTWIERALTLFERAGDEVGITRCRRLERESGMGAVKVK